MRTTAALAGLLTAVLASGLGAQRAPDAVAIDPTHHNVILDNDHVRVWEALVAPGASSPMHSHAPFAFVSLGRARLRLTNADGTSGLLDVHPSQVLWIDGAEHRWTMLSGQVHVIGVEPKAAASGRVPPKVAPPPSDAVTVDPTHHHVIFENDHVRIFEVLAGPGAKSAMHTHVPLVAISMAKARTRMTGPDGKPFIFDLNPAQVLWMEGVQHSWELVAGRVAVIAVEIKAAR